LIENVLPRAKFAETFLNGTLGQCGILLSSKIFTVEFQIDRGNGVIRVEFARKFKVRCSFGEFASFLKFDTPINQRARVPIGNLDGLVVFFRWQLGCCETLFSEAELTVGFGRLGEFEDGNKERFSSFRPEFFVANHNIRGDCGRN